jgi:HK97 family phage major capsid protein
MDQLKGIIAQAIKDNPPDVTAAIKAELGRSDAARLFPGSGGALDGGTFKNTCGSVVDTSYFRKSMSPEMRRMDDHQFATALAYSGGPFKRLSPEMENFGRILKCRGKYSRIAASGINLAKSNDNAMEQFKTVMGLDLKQAGMSEGVVADGGALVPIEFPAMVIEFAFTQSPILSRVWRLTMGTQTMRIPRLVQAAGNYFGGVTFYSPGEGEEKHTSKPQLERLAFEAKKRIALVHLTDELIADSLINVVNYVTGLYVRAFQYDLENLVLTNTAAAGALGVPCLGIINDPAVVANGVARNTAGTINYADLCALDGRLDENFRDLVWMTRKNTLATLRNERDGNNRPIVQVDYDGLITQRTVTPSVFGYPIYLTRNMPAMGSQGDIVLGDLGMYLLAMRQDLTIDTTDTVRWIYDESSIRFVARFDGMPVVPIAFTELVGQS